MIRTELPLCLKPPPQQCHRVKLHASSDPKGSRRIMESGQARFQCGQVLYSDHVIDPTPQCLLCYRSEYECAVSTTICCLLVAQWGDSCCPFFCFELSCGRHYNSGSHWTELELSLLDNGIKMKDQWQGKNQKQTTLATSKTCLWPIGVKGETSSNSHGNLYSPALTTSSAACSQWYQVYTLCSRRHCPLWEKMASLSKDFTTFVIQGNFPEDTRTLLVTVGLIHAYIHFSYGSWSAWTDMSL